MYFLLSENKLTSVSKFLSKELAKFNSLVPILILK